jgi:hypothetical protein
MRFGFAPIRGSNPRASAHDLALCCDRRAPAFLSMINLASCWAIARPAGQAAQNLGELLALPVLRKLDPAEPLAHVAELLSHLAVYDRNAVAFPVDLLRKDIADLVLRLGYPSLTAA